MPHVPRPVRFRRMLEFDNTRRTEFSCGFKVFAVGLWMLTHDYAPNAEAMDALYRSPWDVARAVTMLLFGLHQMMAAGTAWPWMRQWTATVNVFLISYVAIVYWRAAEWSMATPLLALVTLDLVWVAWRIMHDKAVNGYERRGRDDDAAAHR